MDAIESYVEWEKRIEEERSSALKLVNVELGGKLADRRKDLEEFCRNGLRRLYEEKPVGKFVSYISGREIEHGFVVYNEGILSFVNHGNIFDIDKSIEKYQVKNVEDIPLSDFKSFFLIHLAKNLGKLS